MMRSLPLPDLQWIFKRFTKALPWLLGGMLLTGAAACSARVMVFLIGGVCGTFLLAFLIRTVVNGVLLLNTWPRYTWGEPVYVHAAIFGAINGFVLAAWCCDHCSSSSSSSSSLSSSTPTMTLTTTSALASQNPNNVVLSRALEAYSQAWAGWISGGCTLCALIFYSFVEHCISN